MRIMLTMPEPRIDSSTSAKMSTGIAISTSTARLSSWSTQPPSTAAISPRTPPSRNDSMVVRKAMPMVLRAP